MEDLKRFEVPVKLPDKPEAEGDEARWSMAEWKAAHDPLGVVRDAWARRYDGILPLLLEVALDPAAPVPQRCGAVLALGFCDDVRAAESEIGAALSELRESSNPDLSRCAQFAHGVFKR